MKAQKVMFFEASCNGCRARLQVPLLPDQSSGELIFKGENGTSFAYCSSYEEPVWDEISALFDTLVKDKNGGDAESREFMGKFQRVIAHCADPIEGSDLFLSGFICPKCRSRDISYGDGQPSGTRELPWVTFGSFKNLTAEGKEARVRGALAGKLDLGRLHEYFSVVLKLLGPMPSPPRIPSTPITLWLPSTFTRFPEDCPGCGKLSDSRQRVRFEPNPGAKFGGVCFLLVPFCAECIALTDARRFHAVGRIGLAVVTWTIVFNLLGWWHSRLLFEPHPTLAAWVNGATFFMTGLLLLELFRAIYHFWRKSWYFGFRIIAANFGRSMLLVSIDDPDYADKLKRSL